MCKRTYYLKRSLSNTANSLCVPMSLINLLITEERLELKKITETDVLSVGNIIIKIWTRLAGVVP